MTEQPTVTVLVSRELIDQLDDWSNAVQVRIVKTPGLGTGWEMEARAVVCAAWSEDSTVVCAARSGGSE